MESWNRWTYENRSIKPDLEHAVVRNAKLCKVNLNLALSSPTTWSLWFLLDDREEPFSMLVDLQNKYGGDNGWVLDLLKYDNLDNLIGALEPDVIRPALERADYLRVRKAQPIRERHVRQYPRQ